MGWLDSESTEDGRRDARKGADPSPPTFKFFGGRSDEEIAKNVGDYEKAYQTEHLRMMAENSQRTAEAQEVMRKMAEEQNGVSESGGSSYSCGSSSGGASSGVGGMVAVIVVVVFGFVALQHSCSGPSSSGYVQQSAPVPVYRAPVPAYHEPPQAYQQNQAMPAVIPWNAPLGSRVGRVGNTGCSPPQRIEVDYSNCWEIPGGRECSNVCR